MACEGPVRVSDRRPRALQCAVDGGASHAEEFGEFGGAVGADVGEFDQVPGLVGGQLRLLAPEVALGPGDGHAFACPHPDQVGLELGDHREDVEQQPADRVGGVVDGAAEAEADVLRGEFVDDVAGVGQRSGESVEFGDDEGVARAAGGQREPEAGSVAVGAGQAVVDVDAIVTDTERVEGVSLRPRRG